MQKKRARFSSNVLVALFGCRFKGLQNNKWYRIDEVILWANKAKNVGIVGLRRGFLTPLARERTSLRVCLEAGFDSEKCQFFDETRRLFEEHTLRYGRKKQRWIIKKVAFAAQSLASKHTLTSRFRGFSRPRATIYHWRASCLSQLTLQQAFLPGQPAPEIPSCTHPGCCRLPLPPGGGFPGSPDSC